MGRCSTKPFFGCILILVTFAEVALGLPGDHRGDIQVPFEVQGRKYSSLDSMLHGEVGWRNWYEDHLRSWKGQPADIDVMVEGGRDNSLADLQESRDFLQDFFPAAGRPRRRGLDLGAGVGRVVKGVLMNFVRTVDLVDITPAFLHSAQGLLHGLNLEGKYVEASLRDVRLPREAYDLICVQWVLMYLSDRDIVRLLRQAGLALKPNGVLYIKENFNYNEPGAVDVRDAKITRPQWYWESLFDRADLRVLKVARQQQWP
eukprot:RCo037449